MILKLHVQIEAHPDTRWLADAEDLAAKSQSLIASVVKCWSTGPQPCVTVRQDKSELNWEHVTFPLR